VGSERAIEGSTFAPKHLLARRPLALCSNECFVGCSPNLCHKVVLAVIGCSARLSSLLFLFLSLLFSQQVSLSTMDEFNAAGLNTTLV